MLLWISSSSSSLLSLSIFWISSEGRLLVLRRCWWVWWWDVLWILVTLGRLSIELECRFACSLVAIIAMGDGNHTFIPFLLLYICWVSTSRVVVFGTKRDVVVLHPMIILMRRQSNHSKNEESKERQSGKDREEKEKDRRQATLRRLLWWRPSDNTMMYWSYRQRHIQLDSPVFLISS